METLIKFNTPQYQQTFMIKLIKPIKSKLKLAFSFVIFSTFSWSSICFSSALDWQVSEQKDYSGDKFIIFKASYEFGKENAIVSYKIPCHDSIIGGHVLSLNNSNISYDGMGYSLSDDLEFKIQEKWIYDTKKIQQIIQSDYVQFSDRGRKVRLYLRTLLPYLEKYSKKIKQCEALHKAGLDRFRSERKQRELEIKKQKEARQNEDNLNTALSLLGAFVGLIVFVKLILVLKAWSMKKAELIKSMVVRTNESRLDAKVTTKILESAADELGREAVRQSFQPSLCADDIEICHVCNGNKCKECHQRGWVIKPNQIIVI